MNANRPIETLQKMGDKAPLLYLIVTGAGAGFQNDIWEVPGVSNFFIGAQMPYDMEETAKVLGFTPAKFVSEETAIDLALTAYLKAWKPGRQAIGVGVTCSVTSNRNRKGDNRIVVAVFTEVACYTLNVVLQKGNFWNDWEEKKITQEELEACVAEKRKADGELANRLTAYLLTVVVGGVCSAPVSGLNINTNMELARARILAHPYFMASGQRGTVEKINGANTVFYPGAFNPVHSGHLQGAEVAMRVHNFISVTEAMVDLKHGYTILLSDAEIISHFVEFRRTLIFTTTVNPAHKPALTAAEMLQRAAMMKGHNFLLTEDDPLYLDKARKFPGAHFIMGADALERMLDSRWGIDPLNLVKEFSELKTRFLVLGRLIGDTYQTSTDIIAFNGDVQYYLRQYEPFMMIPISFRLDISSSELRAKA